MRNRASALVTYGLPGEPAGALPVEHVATADVRTVALVIPIGAGSDEHRTVRGLAGRLDGGTLTIPLSPAAARLTAGRLAVRADEADPGNAAALAELRRYEVGATLRGLIYSVLPAEMDDGQAMRIAAETAEQIIALGWHPPLPR